MRHVDGSHSDAERDPALSRNHNGTQDGPFPSVIKDFQDHHRPVPRRPSTPNFDRSSPSYGQVQPRQFQTLTTGSDTHPAMSM